MKEDFPQPPAFCLACGYFVDRATRVTTSSRNDPPRPGDYTVCLNCGALSRFTDDLKLTPASLVEIASNPRLLRIAAEAKRFIVERGPIPKKEKPS